MKRIIHVDHSRRPFIQRYVVILSVALLITAGCGRQEHFGATQDFQPRGAETFDPISEPVGQVLLACDLIGAAPGGCLNASPWICLQPDDLMLEGVYSLGEEVRMFSGETIKLNYGRCRYWSSSDVRPTELSYPLAGTYSVDNNRITLRIPGCFDKVETRTLDKINGVRVIWRHDGLKDWTEKHQIKRYGVIFQIKGKASSPDPHAKRLSIQELIGTGK